MENQTYEGERLAAVVAASGMLIGSSGVEITYRVPNTVDPRVEPGDHICLIRRHYDPGPVPGGLRVGWVEVTDVTVEPFAVGTQYECLVEVTRVGSKDSDELVGDGLLAWVFHPYQSWPKEEYIGPYPEGGSAPTVGSAAAPEFDVRGNESNHARFGTIAVLMRSVIKVEPF